MTRTFREILLNGLWERLARHSRAPVYQRTFLIYEITHVLSCREESHE